MSPQPGASCSRAAITPDHSWVEGPGRTRRATAQPVAGAVCPRPSRRAGPSCRPRRARRRGTRAPRRPRPAGAAGGAGGGHRGRDRRTAELGPEQGDVGCAGAGRSFARPPASSITRDAVWGTRPTAAPPSEGGPDHPHVGGAGPPGEHRIVGVAATSTEREEAHVSDSGQVDYRDASTGSGVAGVRRHAPRDQRGRSRSSKRCGRSSTTTRSPRRCRPSCSRATWPSWGWVWLAVGVVLILAGDRRGRAGSEWARWFGIFVAGRGRHAASCRGSTTSPLWTILSVTLAMLVIYTLATYGGGGAYPGDPRRCLTAAAPRWPWWPEPATARARGRQATGTGWRSWRPAAGWTSTQR